jgi:hypothetical protein
MLELPVSLPLVRKGGGDCWESTLNGSRRSQIIVEYSYIAEKYVIHEKKTRWVYTPPSKIPTHTALYAHSHAYPPATQACPSTAPYYPPTLQATLSC